MRYTPLGHAIIVLSQTMYWGENMARGKSNHTMFQTWKKMQAIGDIISYFFPYYFNCHAKKCTKIQLGENIWYFFSQCLYFFPLRPCNNFSTLTDCVLGGKYCKREIKSYFPRWTQSFFVTISELSNSTGGKCMIFFPPVFIFPPVSLFFSPVSSFFPS